MFDRPKYWLSLFISLYIFGFLFVVWRWFFFTSFNFSMSIDQNFWKLTVERSVKGKAPMPKETWNPPVFPNPKPWNGWNNKVELNIDSNTIKIRFTLCVRISRNGQEWIWKRWTRPAKIAMFRRTFAMLMHNLLQAEIMKLNETWEI